VISAALLAMQPCDKHISAAVSQHATVEEACFLWGAPPRLYNEDLKQLESELNGVPELAVAAEN
jgi:hypothetical protein